MTSKLYKISQHHCKVSTGRVWSKHLEGGGYRAYSVYSHNINKCYVYATVGILNDCRQCR